MSDDCHASSSVSATGANPWPPALATSTSIRPNARAPSATAARADAASAASATTGIAQTAASTVCSGSSRAADDDDVRALCGESFGDRGTDAGAASGDHHDPAGDAGSGEYHVWSFS